MHSKAYLEAKKEFVNCIVMSPICLGVSLFLAFSFLETKCTAHVSRHTRYLSMAPEMTICWTCEEPS